MAELMEGYTKEDYLDSGMKPGERGTPISIGEASKAISKWFPSGSYEGLISNFLLRRVRRLEKELSKVRATLDESAANGGAWLV